jgi:hypothetical protein
MLTPAGRDAWQRASGVDVALGVKRALETQIFRPAPGAGTDTGTFFVLPMQISDAMAPQKFELPLLHWTGPPKELPHVIDDPSLTVLDQLLQLFGLAVPVDWVPVKRAALLRSCPSS